ncbi:MAG: hypothetical protein EAZ43_07510 [Betaproteobacteria bacterium]|nr:MAG: hypothetical protein EAZ43_07510 [Betaproteobacteria bacterium]
MAARIPTNSFRPRFRRLLGSFAGGAGAKRMYLSKEICVNPPKSAKSASKKTCTLRQAQRNPHHL